ncbi:hypothetical protein [Limimaricola pyoseonensis]|uniref:Uncharacterized protein n=1 Tax=Limimaricola pyoseonensis TaxID=521013 RepID=A0A1G7H051_9RHOB|nr:hypothetical protein [Limimaricola pyoseonensis]SDE93569.1 hypothetical protein SAMN04488567_3001 [Limimaricola pyoseonensis]
MKTIVKYGAALGLALTPAIAPASPDVMQLLQGLTGAQSKEIRQIERGLRQAAESGDLEAAARVALAAGGVAARGAPQQQAAAAPAPAAAPERRFAPVEIGQRPRARGDLPSTLTAPEATDPALAAVATVEDTPPVTTLRDGRRVETTSSAQIQSAPQQPGVTTVSTVDMQRTPGATATPVTYPAPSAGGTAMASEPFAGVESSFSGPTGY